MENKKETEIQEAVYSICDAIVQEAVKKSIDKFDTYFPMVVEDVNTYADGKPSEIQFWVNRWRDDLSTGSVKLYPELVRVDKRSLSKVQRYSYQGILDGTLWDFIDTKCNDYTDLTRKYFRAVYDDLVNNKIVDDLYDEWTLEKVLEHWEDTKRFLLDTSDEAKEIFVKRHLGAPYFSIKGWNTSEDVMQWFYQMKQYQHKMLQMDWNVEDGFVVAKEN